VFDANALVKQLPRNRTATLLLGHVAYGPVLIVLPRDCDDDAAALAKTPA
jgi:hypothetical protein